MARDFDGVDDFLDAGSPSILDNVNTFTWCAWVQSDVATFSGRVASKRSPSTGLGKNFQSDTSFVARGLRLTVSRAGVDADAVSVAEALPLGVWRFVACTYDGTDGPRLFACGAGDNVAELSYNTRTTGDGAEDSDADGSFIIGARNTSGTDPFDGRICDVHIWNVRLSLADLQAVRCGVHVRRDAMLGWWPVWGAQSPEPDWSGNANHATVSGPVAADHPAGFSALYSVARKVIKLAAATGQNYTQTVTDVVSIADNFIRGVGKYLISALTISDPALTAQKITQKVLTDVVAIRDLAFKLTTIKTITDSISVVDSAARGAGKVIVNAISVLDQPISIVKLLYQKILTETLTVTDSMSRSIVKVLTDTLPITMSVVAQKAVLFIATATERVQVLMTSIFKTTRN